MRGDHFALMACIAVAWLLVAVANGYVGAAAVLPTMVMVVLAQTFGWPKNWWAAFWGTDVKVNVNQHPEIFESGMMGFKIDEWLRDTNVRPYYLVSPGKFRFLRKKHAVMFKLMWG